MAIAAVAAIASPISGFVALWSKPSTLLMSGALGFASGVLLATITFEMLPNALELSSLLPAMGGFVAGFAVVYAFDLFIHRGVLVGEKAEQHPQVSGSTSGIDLAMAKWPCSLAAPAPRK